MKIDDALIDKVLNNESSAEEARKVIEWFATGEGSESLSRRLDEDMEGLTEEQLEQWGIRSIPEGKMKARFLAEIKSKRTFYLTRRFLKIAAVLIPFIFLSASVFFLAERAGVFSATEYAEFEVPCGEQMQVVLQDGTVIQLNSDSRLRYPKRFSLFSRTVELWGEGYFVVAKEKDRPFIVDLQGVKVKVTGTRFNVKAYPDEHNVEVTLDEGGILLQGAGSHEYPLVPGESAKYDRQSGICRITHPEDVMQVSSWRSNSLNFYLTPLKEIIKVMERQYDVRFVVSDSSLLSLRFTLSTSKVNVDDVLHDLEEVSHIRFVQKENRVFEILSD
ncbi:FecR family protein [Bacteroides sp.]